MTAVPQEGRERARQFSDAFVTAGLALGVASHEAGPLQPVMGLMAALSGVLPWQANRLAEDPPDPRYREPVTVPGSRLRVDAFPRGREQHLMAHASAAIHRSHRYLGATVDAFERAQGAALAGDRGAELDRLAETRRFAERSSSALNELSYELYVLQGARRELDFPRPGRAGLARDDATLALAYRAGVRVDDFDRGLAMLAGPPARPEDPDNAIESALLPTYELAAFLSRWAPMTGQRAQ